jgi:glutamate-1-semialdehyde 2,1-aminomutase
MMSPDKLCLNREKLQAFTEIETSRFQQKIPKSRALFEESKSVMIAGVPAAWMGNFYPGTEMFIEQGAGCYFQDVDGNRFLDMTQCDLSMICGFGPEPVARAVSEQFSKGSHFLLPTENAIVTSKLLSERFHMPYWQYTLSASAANTEAIRISRYSTGREKVLIFDGKYHGHIDEVMVSADAEKMVPDQLGLPKNVTEGTVVVPFNDVEAIERELKLGNVACVLTEPALTNVGVVHPDDGFHKDLRALTRKYGAVLIMDETHTQAGSFGGLTNLWGLEPDILTLGKSVGGGVPLGAYGLSHELGKLVEASQTTEADGRQNIALGGTMYGNALNMSAARAALEHVLTETGYLRVQSLAKKLADGMEQVIKNRGFPWRTFRLGNRTGICLSETLPRTGAEARECIDRELNYATRAFMANRGIWEPVYVHGPSVSFAHNENDVETYLSTFNELLDVFMTMR